MYKNIAYHGIKQALEKTTTVTAGSLVSALLFVILIYDYAQPFIVYIWFSFMLAQQLLRQWYSRYLLSHLKSDESAVVRNTKYYHFFIFLSALGWGSIGPIFILNSEEQMVLIYVTAYAIGILAGSTFSLATIPKYFYTFMITLEAPILISLLVMGNYDAAILIATFILFTIQSGREVQKSVRNNLELNFKNEKLIEDLQAADKLKSEFLANMSHEIRTPMNAILGFIQILKDDETNKEKVQYLDTISNSGKDLLQIIDDILDFSKIEINQLTIEYIPFNPKERIEQAINLLKNPASAKNIELKLRYLNDIPQHLFSDPTRIIQVINNLLSNEVFAKLWKRDNFLAKRC